MRRLEVGEVQLHLLYATLEEIVLAILFIAVLNRTRMPASSTLERDDLFLHFVFRDTKYRNVLSGCRSKQSKDFVELIDYRVLYIARDVGGESVQLRHSQIPLLVAVH